MDWLKKSTRTKTAVDTTEKRKAFRMACSVPMVIQVDNSSAIEGRVVNLSTTGLKLQLGQMLKVGATYTVWIRGRTLPGGLPPRELGVQGKCSWTQRTKSGACEAGLLFTDFFGNPLAQVLQFFDRELSVSLGDGLQKRSHLRAAKRLKITYELCSEGRVANGLTRNLGEGGLALFSKNRIEVDTDLNLLIYLDGNTDKFRASGTVTRFRKIQDQDLYEMGIRFSGLVDSERERIISYVAACMLDNSTEP